jgi:hypothetical protein
VVVKKERAGDVDELRLAVGERFELESLRQNVVPPYVMLTPFVETPAGMDVEAQQALPEDGVHGSIYRIRAGVPAHGELVVGFKDVLSGKVTHRKAIRVYVGDG